MKVRTLVVDDEPVARAGLRAMLTAFEWVEVVGEAADGEEAVEEINRLQPELVVLTGRGRAIPRIGREQPELGVGWSVQHPRRAYGASHRGTVSNCTHDTVMR